MAGVMSPLIASCVDVRGSPCWGLRRRVTRRWVNAIARLGLPQNIWVIQARLVGTFVSLFLVDDPSA